MPRIGRGDQLHTGCKGTTSIMYGGYTISLIALCPFLISEPLAEPMHTAHPAQDPLTPPRLLTPETVPGQVVAAVRAGASTEVVITAPVMGAVVVLPSDRIHGSDHSALTLSLAEQPAGPLLLLGDLTGCLLLQKVLVPLRTLAGLPGRRTNIAELVATPVTRKRRNQDLRSLASRLPFDRRRSMDVFN